MPIISYNILSGLMRLSLTARLLNGTVLRGPSPLFAIAIVKLPLTAKLLEVCFRRGFTALPPTSRQHRGSTSTVVVSTL
jgi:hypothetical protein